MNILLVGGTPSVRGGVELFCERARLALVDVGCHRVEVIHTNTAYFKLKSMGPTLRCVWQLVSQRRQPWDCVWLQYTNFPELLLLALCWLLGYRVLVTPHLGSNWSSQSNMWLRWIGSRLLGLAHGLALLSKTQADELVLPVSVPQYQIKTFLPRYFPASTLQPGSPPGDKLTLVHAGRLSEGKGTFVFLEICTILHERGRAFSAQLIGSCDAGTRRKIDAIIADRGLGACVEVMQPLPEVNLMKVLATMDVLVHLSDIDSFPLIVLEAIGCGVFPICKDLPGARFMTELYCGHIIAGVTAAAEVADYLIEVTPLSLHALTAPASRLVAHDYGWPACVARFEAAVAAMLR